MLFASVTITGASLQVGSPETLLEGGIMPYGSQYAERTFDVAPDGRMIVMDVGAAETQRSSSFNSGLNG